MWHAITGHRPPTRPPTAQQYTKAGLLWFDYYDDEARPLEGTETLKGLKSVAKFGEEKNEVPLPENEPVSPDFIIGLQPGHKSKVREGDF